MARELGGKFLLILDRTMYVFDIISNVLLKDKESLYYLIICWHINLQVIDTQILAAPKLLLGITSSLRLVPKLEELEPELRNLNRTRIRTLRRLKEPN